MDTTKLKRIDKKSYREEWKALAIHIHIAKVRDLFAEI